jgi:acetoacetyl-CoA reductase
MESLDANVGRNAISSGGNGSGEARTKSTGAPSTGAVSVLARPIRPLDGRVALVSGASRGIGRAIAIELAAAGAAVAVNYHTSEAAAKEVEGAIVGEGGNAFSVFADVSQPSDVRAMVELVVAQFGRIDILVNNSGITRDRTLHKLKDEDWLAVINTNLNSVFFCTSAVVLGMMERKYGRIINISSLSGQAGNFGQCNYAAAKAGILGFTKAAALELARYNITVNAVAPGFTATDMFSRVPDDIQEQIKAKIPARRFATPKEIAEAALFLAAHGDYVTGQVIGVNGGMYM